MEHGFELPLYLDLFAVFLMSATGAIEAIRREFDLVGLLGLSLATGVGGALIRDGIFLQAGVPAVVRNQDYLLAVAAGAGACLIFGRRAVVSEKFVAVVDAAALGAYAVVGMEKSLAFGLDFVPAVLVGTVNACGGGLLRDIFTREQPLVFRPGQFYAFAAIIGCLTYPLLRQGANLPAFVAACGTIGVTFSLRMLAITRNWCTAPVGDRGLLPRRRHQAEVVSLDAAPRQTATLVQSPLPADTTALHTAPEKAAGEEHP